MAGGISTIEKHSFLAYRSWRWQHHLLQNQFDLYLVSTALNAGTLSAVGGKVTIDKWMQESHGPTLNLIDNTAAGLLASFKIVGRDQFNRPCTYNFVDLADAAGGSGTFHQCPQPFSYIESIETTKISGAAASDAIALGVFRSSVNNGVWYGAPCDMRKSGLPVASYFSNQDNSLMPFQDTNLDYNALRYSTSVSALLDVTTIFDPRKARF